MKDRNTTICGILTIVGAACAAGVLYLHGNVTAALSTLGTGVTTGLGLIKAADSKVAAQPAPADNKVQSAAAGQ